MPSYDIGALEGTAFAVYSYVIKENKPVGPRDVMRGANLSSPSVAYNHLKKLEEIGLLEKNQEGRYFVKEKAKINGYLWFGRTLVPRLIFYSFFFTGILGAEIFIIIMGFLFYESVPEALFIYLTIITAISMLLFLLEGLSLRKKAVTNN